MQAIRQIITPCSDNLSLRLPKEFLNKKLEVIILPYTEDKEPYRITDTSKLTSDPIKVEKIILPSREEIHER